MILDLPELELVNCVSSLEKLRAKVQEAVAMLKPMTDSVFNSSGSSSSNIHSSLSASMSTHNV